MHSVMLIDALLVWLGMGAVGWALVAFDKPWDKGDE